MKYPLLIISAWAICIAAIAQNTPKGLAAGSIAPDFYATDQYGKKTELGTILKKGPVVLLFYRGQWCPYCNRQLSQLQDSLLQITEQGATVIAVTPEKPGSINETINKTKASFQILHDKGLKIMKAYDVAYTVNDVTNAKLKKYGIDLEKINGKNGSKLPVPAVYIINQKGVITYVHFDQDYTHRASVAEILRHL
jgi:peroxiredoxin